MIDEKIQYSILKKLIFLYGEEKAPKILDEVIKLIDDFPMNSPSMRKWPNEKDVFLITYGDSILDEDDVPLKVLYTFLKKFLAEYISYVHILPFYPYSSDDGFSIIDYYMVDKDLGSWHEIEVLAHDFSLMFDAVINHISAQSRWFKEFLAGNQEYADFFIETENSPALSVVTRPRTLPLLSEFRERILWTTFSSDQLDLNYKNEKVLLAILELLLFYVAHGAKALRLDAVGFLWKEIGTSCIHLPQTHTIVQLFRDVFDVVAPEVLLITETNVPHKDNISYFGNGFNEAQLVYQFPLPPLVLHALITGNAKSLAEWSTTLLPISENTTYFNFLASHDGIGIVPASGILGNDEIQLLIDRVKTNGGNVSYKTGADGKAVPYELNINYYDALVGEGDTSDKFMVAQAILLAMQGVPAIYIHSILGSRNYYEGLEKTSRYRSINREKLLRNNLEKELADKKSLRYNIFQRYTKLISIRRNEKAFHPNAPQKIVFTDDRVFSFVRGIGKNEIFILNNVSNEDVVIDADEGPYYDLISGKKFDALELRPYQVMWLKHLER